MNRVILALDQGTTSSRALIFDAEGRLLAVAQRELTQHYPRPGWVEHDPAEILESQFAVAQEALAKGGIYPGQVAAIAVANQRETTLLWDRHTGEAVGPAIVWQDRRTADRCDALREDSRIQELTGLVPDAYFSASKLEWMLDHIPGVRERAERGDLRFGTVDCFLLWHLTEGREHRTDVTNASRTMLFDIHRMEWSAELLRLFRIPDAVLPEVMPTQSGFGYTTRFGGVIPITAMAGDQHAALFGQRCQRVGMAKATYGTGCFLLMNAGLKPPTSQNRLLATVAWQRVGQPVEYALEGSVFVAGAAIQWLRDGLGIIQTADETSAMAQSVAGTAGVVMVPAFVGLGAPHWDSAARGVISGLTRGAGKAHIVRAALESIAYQCRDVLKAMEADTGHQLGELRVDGGATNNEFLMQFQADILDIPVIRAGNPESTALGAACLAGLGCGHWASSNALPIPEGTRFEPSMGELTRAELLENWRLALHKAMA